MKRISFTLFFALLALLNVSAAPVSGAAKAVHRAVSGWTSLGTGYLRDDFVTSYYIVEPADFEVEISESESTPGLYIVENPYAKSPYAMDYQWPISVGPSEGSNYIKVHAENPEKVWIEASPTGLQFPDGTYLIVNSYAGLMYDNNGGSWDFEDAQKAADVEGAFGALIDGVITFPEGTLLSQCSADAYTTALNWDYANLNGAFRLRLPSAKCYDMQVEANRTGTLLNAAIKAEKDVEYIDVAFAEGDDDWALVEQMMAGSVSTQRIDGREGSLQLEIPANGHYALVALAYGDGEAQTYSSYIREYYVYEDEWKICAGKAQYTDGLISGICTSEPVTESNANFLGLDSWTGEVEVHVNKANPGLIRLVNPFSYESGCTAASRTNYDASNNYYMELDIADPGYVMLNKMEDLGLRFNFGKLEAWGRTPWYCEIRGEAQGWYDHSELAYTYAGTLSEGVITFPVCALTARFPMVQVSPFARYYANSKGEFRVVLPEELVTSLQKVQTEAKDAVYYDLMGRKVAHPAHGLYIKVENGQAKKVMR